MSSDIHLAFQRSDVDTLKEGLFAFLDRVDGLPLVQAVKHRMAGVLDRRQGLRILDLGCGMGHELPRLAELARPGGCVIGVDLNPDMIAEARRRTAHLGDLVECRTGDAQRLDLADSSMDVVRAERVLMYVPDQMRAINEIVRVVKPGGTVVVFELDYGAATIDMPDRSAARRVQDTLEATLPHPWTGRSLGRLFYDAGLRDVTSEPIAMPLSYDLYLRLAQPALAAAVESGALDAATYRKWLDAGEAAHRAGRFFDTFLGMIVWARKPE
ncbi:methyltransferase domain-containing protein [Acrocarpospora catenulata]|uniref:methyltransferase domain-containing protein n=1 Tax=Acrocarpospora catenulata TaxID=2836182 RepID=UPI001BDA6E77|nr:methyltransferase domain-containing protein [Acrocarpospora catenulata]